MRTVFEVRVVTKNIFSDLLAKYKSILGGRVKCYEEIIKSALEDAEAYALSKKAEAISKSNDVVVLKQIEAELQAIEKWDGKLPIATGGSIPFINLGSSLNISQ